MYILHSFLKLQTVYHSEVKKKVEFLSLLNREIDEKKERIQQVLGAIRTLSQAFGTEVNVTSSLLIDPVYEGEEDGGESGEGKGGGGGDETNQEETIGGNDEVTGRGQNEGIQNMLGCKSEVWNEEGTIETHIRGLHPFNDNSVSDLHSHKHPQERRISKTSAGPFHAQEVKPCARNALERNEKNIKEERKEDEDSTASRTNKENTRG